MRPSDQQLDDFILEVQEKMTSGVMKEVALSEEELQ